MDRIPDMSSTSDEEGKNSSTVRNLLQTVVTETVAASGSDNPTLATATAATSAAFSAVRRAFKQWWKLFLDAVSKVATSLKSALERTAAALVTAFRTMAEHLSTSYSSFVDWIRAVRKIDPKVPDISHIEQASVDNLYIAFNFYCNSPKSSQKGVFCGILKGHMLTLSHGSDSEKFETSLKFFRENPDAWKALCDQADEASDTVYSAFDDGRLPIDLLTLERQSGWLSWLSPGSATGALITLFLSVSSVAQFCSGAKYAGLFSKITFSSISSLFSVLGSIDRIGLTQQINKFVDRIYFLITGSHLTVYAELCSKWQENVNIANSCLEKIGSHRNPSPIVIHQLSEAMAVLSNTYALIVTADPKSSNQYRTVYQDLKQRSAVWDRGAFSGERIKPVVIVLRGPAGVGKTASQNELVRQTMKVVGQFSYASATPHEVAESIDALAKNPSCFSYTCSGPVPSFDDGYMNHTFVAFEELGSIKDNATNLEWIKKFMAFADSQPLLLNTAFEDKGKRYFNSPFVLATYNGDALPCINSFNDPIAMHRRIELHLTVTNTVPNKRFDIKNVQFTPVKECLDVLKDARLCPSPVIGKMIGKDSFGIDHLLKLAAAAYYERIHQTRANMQIDNLVLPGSDPFVRYFSILDNPVDSVRSTYGKPAKCYDRDRGSDAPKLSVKHIPTEEEILSWYPSMSLPLEYIQHSKTSGTVKSGNIRVHYRLEAPLEEDDEDDVIELELQGGELDWDDDTAGMTSAQKWAYRIEGAKALYSDKHPLVQFYPGECVSVISSILNFRPGEFAKESFVDSIAAKTVPSSEHFALYYAHTFKGYPAARLLSTRLSTHADEVKFIKWAVTFVGRLKGLRTYLTENKAILLSISDQDCLRGSVRACYRALSDPQKRQVEYRLKREGLRPIGTSGAVGPLPASEIAAYQHRQTLNAKRNNTKPPRSEPRRARVVRVSDSTYKSQMSKGKARVKRDQQKRAADRMAKFERQNGTSSIIRALRINVESSHVIFADLPPSYMQHDLISRAFIFTRSDFFKNLRDEATLVEAFYHTFLLSGCSKETALATAIWAAVFALNADFKGSPPKTPACTYTNIKHSLKTEDQKLRALFLAVCKYELGSPPSDNDLLYYGAAFDFAFSGEAHEKLADGFYDDAFAAMVDKTCTTYLAQLEKQPIRPETFANLPSPSGNGIAVILGSLFSFVVSIGISAAIVYGIVKLTLYMSGGNPTPAADVTSLESALEAQGLKLVVQSADPDPNKKGSVATTASMANLVKQNGAEVCTNVLDKVARNMYSVWVYPTEQSKLSDVAYYMGSLTFVAGKYALIPKHVMRSCHRAFCTVIVPCVDAPNRLSFEFRSADMQLISMTPERDDRAIVLINKTQMPPHANIVSHFISESDNVIYGKTYTGLGLRSCKEFKKYVYAPVEEMYRCNFDSEMIIDQLDARNFDNYRWAGAGKAACGGLIFHSIANKRYKVRSMHVLGDNKGNGAGIPLTTEWIQSVLDLERQCGNAWLSMGFEDSDPTGGYLVDGSSIKTPIVTSALGVTSFVPTIFSKYEFDGGSPVKPAKLCQTSYELARNKAAARNQCGSNPKARVLVRELAPVIVEKLFCRQLVDLPRCFTLSIHDALFGSELEPFDPTTSSGIRLRLWNVDKKKLLGYGDNLPDLDTFSVFESKMNILLDSFRAGQWTHQINVDKLKDETLPVEQVNAYKARLFNVTDFVDNVLIKMAVGGFVAATKSSYLSGPQSCGINMRGSAARAVYNMFLGRDVVACDISGFDFTVNDTVMEVVSLIARTCYGDKFSQDFFCWAFLSCLKAFNFDKGEARWRGLGNTSGNWITTFLNTIMNMCYFVCTIKHMSPPDDPDAYSRLIVKLYSDDNLSALPDASWYSPSSLAVAAMNLFGITLTGTDKGDVTSVCSIDEAEFLSRTFRNEHGTVFCPLAYSSLVGQLYYVRVPHEVHNDPNFIAQQLQINLSNVALELLEYPHAERHAVARRIFSFLEEHGNPSWFPFSFASDQYYDRVQTA